MHDIIPRGLKRKEQAMTRVANSMAARSSAQRKCNSNVALPPTTSVLALYLRVLMAIPLGCISE
jgi:hypothetical protein